MGAAGVAVGRLGVVEKSGPAGAAGAAVERVGVAEKRELAAGGRGEKMLFGEGSTRLLSNDMRGRTVNGVPGADSVSPAPFGRPKRGRSLWRCWRVDRRREEERLGMVAYWPRFGRGLGLNGPSLTNGLAGAFSVSWSKMLKSVEKLGV